MTNNNTISISNTICGLGFLGNSPEKRIAKLSLKTDITVSSMSIEYEYRVWGVSVRSITYDYRDHSSI